MDPLCDRLTGSLACGGLRSFQRFDRLAASSDGIATRGTIRTRLQTGFGLFEKRLGLCQLLARHLFGARIMSRSNRLTRITHFLDRRSRTGGQRTADRRDERAQTKATRDGMTHECVGVLLKPSLFAWVLSNGHLHRQDARDYNAGARHGARALHYTHIGAREAPMTSSGPGVSSRG